MSTTATLTFNDKSAALDFATKWTRKTLTGHTISAVKVNGSVDVKVYDVTEDRKQFIEQYISENS